MTIREETEAIERQILSRYATLSETAWAAVCRWSRTRSGPASSGTGTAFCTAKRSAA